MCQGDGISRLYQTDGISRLYQGDGISRLYQGDGISRLYQRDGISRVSIPSVRPLQVASHLRLRMRCMVLGDDRREIGRARCPQPFGSDLRVIGVDPISAGKGRPRSEQSIQRPSRHGPKEDGQAALDDREVCHAFAQVVQERRLLEQHVWVTVESGHGLEHVDPVALIIDR